MTQPKSSQSNTSYVTSLPEKTHVVFSNLSTCNCHHLFSPRSFSQNNRNNKPMTMLCRAAGRRLLVSLQQSKTKRPSFSVSSLEWPLSTTYSIHTNRKCFSTTPSDTSNTITTVDPELQKQITTTCASLHGSIMPLNEKLRGPLAVHSDRGTALPFVLAVGNHSSGKSSFLNYCMGRDIQTTGVAPTDDVFTILAPGPTDQDQDGPALVGDPDLGFANLRQFGPTLIHHTQLKIRSGIQNQSFMLVDSPGMIDSPRTNTEATNTNNSNNDVMDRGYDFTGVVRWFAQRADVVLLFFDPDKPGTTGETLSVLLHSLAGMDHKLLIILNKADQFKKIHDFARAYGSLCWNLSKVIPRKDLPRIFTMCLPVENADSESSSGLQDLHQTRHDVVAEVNKAPKRRMDNVITHLNDSVYLLKMHALVLREVQDVYNRAVWNGRYQQAGAAGLGTTLATLTSMYTDLPVSVTAALVALTVLSTGGLHWYNSLQLSELEQRLSTPQELSMLFQKTHSREVYEADEFTASTWQRVRDPLRLALENMGLASMGMPTQKEIQALDDILETEIPKLRRLASPEHFGKD